MANDLFQVSNTLSDIFDLIVIVIVAFSLIVFLWGVVEFIMNADNDAKRAEGRQFMIWGIVGLFVMISVWGLVNILVETFGTGDLEIPLKVEFP